MIIILKESATDEQVDHVVRPGREARTVKTHLSRGTYRTVIGVIGDEAKLQASVARGDSRRGEVVPVMPAYKLASREAHPQPTLVTVGSGRRGRRRSAAGHLGMIAGPCAVESAERLDEIAGAIKAAGANILRGGAFKPRTSPYSFQGLGEEGLKILRRGRRQARPAGRDRGDRPPARGAGGRVRGHAAARRPQHAELRPADRGGQDEEAGADEAGHGRHGEGPADERRVRASPTARPTWCWSSGA